MYQENAKVAAIFWEWRYKIMVAFFAGNAALFTLAGWLYQHPELRHLLFGPLSLGAVLSAVSLFLDWRNAKILKECYRVGGTIEHELLKRGAIFEAIGKAHGKGVTYTLVLGVIYFIVCFFLIMLSAKVYDRFG